MINWNIINNKQFEDLSYKYISSKYPDLNWESTKYTRDGNKDGEANYEAPLDISIKYWYEAKYSKTPNKSIPKSHLDSTLVSSMLDGKVMLIAFITNASLVITIISLDTLGDSTFTLYILYPIIANVGFP